MKNKIFLSYSYNDRPWVEQFAIALEKEGIDVWFDFHDIALGENITERLQSALRASNTLVVLLSSNSVKSRGIFFELGAAIADNKRIIPIVIDDVGYEQLSLPLIKYQYLHESSPVSAAKKVAKAVKN
jgi:hypothetical protein